MVATELDEKKGAVEIFRYVHSTNGKAFQWQTKYEDCDDDGGCDAAQTVFAIRRDCVSIIGPRALAYHSLELRHVDHNANFLELPATTRPSKIDETQVRLLHLMHEWQKFLEQFAPESVR